MEENQHIPSREGKIGIFLALLGIGGTGALQVLPHPYNDYVGWTLIWVAIIGAVALGVYHVSAVVAPPRYEPKPKPKPIMTAAEIGFLTALGATALSLISLGFRHRSTAAVLALIACLAVAFDFADRQWFFAAEPTETPLGSDNARLDLQPNPVWKDDQRQFFMNLRQVNEGKQTAHYIGHSASASVTSGLIDSDLLSAIFIVLHSKAMAVTNPYNEYYVGQSDQYFTVPETIVGMQFDAATYPIAKQGNLSIYILVSLKYQDDMVPKGKSIYTEKCFYMRGPAIHYCETGHNRSYISN